MAVTDDTIVAKFLQVKLREQFPKCDTQYSDVRHGRRPDRIPVVAVPKWSFALKSFPWQDPRCALRAAGVLPSCGKIWGKAPGLPYVNFAGSSYRDLRSGKAPG